MTVHQDEHLEAQLAAVTDRLARRFGDVHPAVVESSRRCGTASTRDDPPS